MKERLRKAIDRYMSIDPSLLPFPFGQARHDALVEFLHALASEYGQKLDFTRVDANGEVLLAVVDDNGRAGGRYNEDMARVVSRVPWRMGLYSTGGPIRPNEGIGPESGWCRIHHLDVEQLLLMLAEEAAPTLADMLPAGQPSCDSPSP